MLSRWFRDWRDRRSAMRELRAAQSADEAALADSVDNPLVRAKAAAVRGELDLAARLWEEARLRMSGFVVTSNDAFRLLLDLGRYDEADALMRARRARSPGDPFCAPSMAMIAELRGDFEEAARRWDAVRAVNHSDLEAHFHGNYCLRQLGRFDECATLMDDAIAREPGSLDAWMERAGIEERRGRPEGSLLFLKQAMEHCGFHTPLTVYVRILTDLGRTAEAVTFLDHMIKANPGDANILTERARLARGLGDRQTAVACWADVRHFAPSFAPGYQEAAECLRELGDIDGAEAILLDAAAHFHDKAWPLIAYARMAHDREYWAEAAARWARVTERFMDEEEARVLGAEAVNKAGAAASGS